MYDLAEDPLHLFFVVDEEQRLVSALSRGDIKRALIGAWAADTPILEVCNPNPLALLDRASWEQDARNIFSTRPLVNCLPLLDAERRITNVVVRYPYEEFDVVLPREQVIKILDKHGLARNENGSLKWWLAAYIHRRNACDEPSRGVLRFIRDNISCDSRIFITGCGCGWFLLWMAQNGFTNLSGSDILPECISAAQDLAKLAGARYEVWVDNGFRPNRIPRNCHAVLAIHWLFSAWDGNYSRDNEGLKEQDHLKLLKCFIEQYAPHVADNGYLVLELIDKISSERAEESGIYPVRHSAEEVASCLAEFGFRVEKRIIGLSHQIRAIYFARKCI
ncbi:MAG: hypothetical protein AAB229_03315 [Candidatus Hydrogenedentota bacterium]